MKTDFVFFDMPNAQRRITEPILKRKGKKEEGEGI
jgi:hypothetical protein